MSTKPEMEAGMKRLKVKRPHATRTTLGRFLAVAPKATLGDRNEKIWVCSWGPILLIVPAERRAWSAPS